MQGMAIIWKPVKRKDGTIDHYVIQDSTGKYRITRSGPITAYIYTAWASGKAIHYSDDPGACRKACEVDLANPYIPTGNEEVGMAIASMRALLK